jgi:pyruvate/2-oxoglutarate/acetoin dehydrogenase E1 component
MYLNFSEAIKKSILENMKIDKNIIIFGLGVTDPKNIFGTTEGLLKIFGKNWKKIKSIIETRTIAQIRSHA